MATAPPPGPRGTILMVQNSLTKVPESNYRPAKPLPLLEKGYSLRAKGSRPTEGFCVLEQISSTSYTAVKGLGSQSAIPTHFIRIELTQYAGSPKQLKVSFIFLLCMF